MKHKLEIVQSEDGIILFFKFSQNFLPKKLQLYNKENSLYVNIIKEHSQYTCKIPYKLILKNFSEKVNFKIHGQLKNNKKTTRLLVGNFREIKYDYFRRIVNSGAELYPYFTLDNNLALLISKIEDTDKSNLKVNIKTKIENIKCKSGSIVLGGNIQAYSNKIEKASLIFKGRQTRAVIEHHINLMTHRDTKGYFHHTFDAEVFFSNFDLEEDTYDFFWGFTLPGFKPTIIERRVGNIPYKLRRKVRTLKIEHDDITFIDPYFTFKGKNLSFSVEKIDKNIFSYYTKLQHKKQRTPIWLIGEQPYKAQDTGYHFFKYMRENFPEKKVYYVIRFDSPEYNNIKDLGNVIEYRSKKHFEVLFNATHLIASHHPYYLFPLTHPALLKSIKAKKIFLQHGVFGTKNISNLYAKTIDSFDIDMFLVSSEKEKGFAVEDLHFLDDEVKITGLSRFDALFANDVPLKRQILIIPTWRDWLQNYDAFVESEYYQRYKSLLESQALRELCHKNKLKIVFSLHPNMQKFVDLFNLDGVQVVKQGEVNVQHLLKESMLMITDYSSVGFDFSFLDKPVLYYQFDTKRFLGKLPSHLDIDEDLPGDIVRDEDSLIELLQHYINNDFVISNENRTKASQFLKYKDQNNCLRIKKEIEDFDIKKHPIDKAIKTELFMGTLKKFRTSKYYFPIMRNYYKIMKFFPLKERVVFESGLGVQYADAPRYIFEELLSRRPDKEYIWVSNKKLYNMPKNVKVVERLSWRYYYYLATSKYWVNNQNFPYYITKRKSTTFLQTWHGTPLKKMLYDIENIQGRDDGYIRRVEQAKNQWSYLLSQSPYATEKFRSAFRYKGPILELGYSRNDILVNNAHNLDYINKIKNKLKIPKDKKIILYAPTFRDNAKKVGNKFTMDLKINFDTFINKIPEDHILLLRLHVLVKQNQKSIEKYNHRIFDVSDYPDIQELFLISNILITDYSSVFFDYANLRRPILFYAYDLEEYRNNLRGFYMDYDNDLPGPIIKTEKQLYHAINNIERYDLAYKNKYITFIKKYLPKDDGMATKRIVDHVFGAKYQPENNND